MEWAKKIAESGVQYYIEVANMPTTNDALEFLKEPEAHGRRSFQGCQRLRRVRVRAGDGSERSSVSTGPLRKSTPRWKRIMKNIYNASVEAAERYGLGYDLVAGANIAGFQKVADAMMAQGIF